MNNRLLGIQILDVGNQEISAFEFSMKMSIEAGLYSLKIFCSDLSGAIETRNREDSGWIGPIRVNWDYEGKQPPFHGMFGIPTHGRDLVSEKEIF